MRLIDADAFDERVRAAGGMSEEELSEDFKDGVLSVLYMMSKQPAITAQPEQAVKGCRNCKYGKYNDHWKTHFCYNPNECTEWNLWEPSAQPERKRGKWNVTDAYPHNVYCSECHKRFAQTHWAVWEDGSLPRNFCPNCGADMRGKQE